MPAPTLTLFAIPKAFRGHIDLIQRNAITSWTHLHPRPDILLLGNDEGTENVARELGLRHVPTIACNEFGTPLVSDLFAQGERAATTPSLAYVNADIMLTDDFVVAIETVRKAFGRFLMIGRRWDLDLTVPWDFGVAGWQHDLAERAHQTNVLRPATFIDYFAFSRGFAEGLPPLAIGRSMWDNYLVWRGRASGNAVVDATRAVTAVHQTHDYGHHPAGASGIWNGPEAKRNRDLTGGWWHRYTIDDATHRLTPRGLERSRLHPWLMAKRLWSHPLTIFTWPLQAMRRSSGSESGL